MCRMWTSCSWKLLLLKKQTLVVQQYLVCIIYSLCDWAVYTSFNLCTCARVRGQFVVCSLPQKIWRFRHWIMAIFPIINFHTCSPCHFLKIVETCWVACHTGMTALMLWKEISSARVLNDIHDHLIKLQPQTLYSSISPPYSNHEICTMWKFLASCPGHSHVFNSVCNMKS